MSTTYPLDAGSQHAAQHGGNVERQETHDIGIIFLRYNEVRIRNLYSSLYPWKYCQGDEEN